MQKKIAVSDEDLIKLLNPEEIVFASRQGREVMIKTFDKTYSVNYTLQALENRLGDLPFFRPHYSFLVNIDKIERIEPGFQGHQLVMQDEDCSRVPVSRNGMKEIRRLLGKLNHV